MVCLTYLWHICYICDMADINIRSVAADLRNAFKAYCATKGTTMRRELIRYMESVTEIERARIAGAELARKQQAKR